MEGQWFRLGGKASAFWDPTQPDPDNQFLRADEVKKLVINPKVSEWKNRGGLVSLSEEEAQKLLSAKEKAGLKAVNKATDALNAAAQKEEEAKEKMKEAEVKLKAAAKVEAENKKLAEERDALLKRNQELEDAAAGKKAGDAK